MKYDSALHNRHSIRLRDYDYASAGAYFVTICLNQRIPKNMGNNGKSNAKYYFPTFGIIENDAVLLNAAGKMIQKTWDEIPDRYENIGIGEFVVMPDHIHGIIKINGSDAVGAAHRGCPNSATLCLSDMIYYFKTRTTNEYINGVKTSDWVPFRKKLWQRNYYEHIIRNEEEYSKISNYIHKNPIMWQKR